MRRFAATGDCAPAWLAATSTHIDVAAPNPATSDPDALTAPSTNQRDARTDRGHRDCRNRCTAVAPSDVENKAPKPTPAASRSASMTPATPSAAMHHSGAE